MRIGAININIADLRQRINESNIGTRVNNLSFYSKLSVGSYSLGVVSGEVGYLVAIYISPEAPSVRSLIYFAGACTGIGTGLYAVRGLRWVDKRLRKSLGV